MVDIVNERQKKALKYELPNFITASEGGSGALSGVHAAPPGRRKHGL